MVTALRTSRGKIPNSKMLWLGTRPADSSHPFQRALDGHGVALALSYQAGKDDPPFHRATWLKSNPSLRYGFPDLEAVIREEADDAKRDPDSLAGFKALRLNQGVSDVHRAMLLDAEAWRRITVSTEDAGSKRGGHVLGVDLGSGAAMSAVSAYFPDGRLEVVACFPELPTLAECGLADGVGRLYVSMSDRGELIQHGRRVADVKALLMEVLDRWAVRLPLCAIGGGKPNSGTLASRCGSRWRRWSSAVRDSRTARKMLGVFGRPCWVVTSAPRNRCLWLRLSPRRG